jgi:hypothetical protein
MSSMENGSPNGKEVSIVSKFDEHERHSILSSVHSVHSHLSRDHNNSREHYSREYYSREYHSREYYSRDRRGSEEAEAPSVRRLGSARVSLSHSSKGPSWVDKPTPSTSFLLGGVLSGPAAAGLLPSFVWNGKKPRALEQLDIEAVIAKLEHTAKPADCHLRMNHDDPGLLGTDNEATTAPQPQVQPGSSSSAAVALEDVSEGVGGEIGAAYSRDASANMSSLDVLRDLEGGVGDNSNPSGVH